MAAKSIPPTKARGWPCRNISSGPDPDRSGDRKSAAWSCRSPEISGWIQVNWDFAQGRPEGRLAGEGDRIPVLLVTGVRLPISRGTDMGTNQEQFKER